jgi:hypothetical protein
MVTIIPYLKVFKCEGKSLVININNQPFLHLNSSHTSAEFCQLYTIWVSSSVNIQAVEYLSDSPKGNTSRGDLDGRLERNKGN